MGAKEDGTVWDLEMKEKCYSWGGRECRGLRNLARPRVRSEGLGHLARGVRDKYLALVGALRAQSAGEFEK